MLRVTIQFLIVCLIAWAPARLAVAQPGESRVALVVGNAAYSSADPLRNPINDARAMARVLRETGFEVILRENATRREMTEAMREFSSKVTPGGVGLFYYAGHGVQVRGANYLLPVDVVLASEDELKYEAIDVNDILSRMDEARVRLSLVILDACRDNPFPRRFRSAGRGLAQLDTPRGTMIAYATAPGETAADGDGQNGLYTEELLKAIATPSLKLEDVFKRAIDGVAQRSGNKQTPWVSSSFRGDFYFMPVTIVMPPGTTGGAAPGAATDQALSPQAIEHGAWAAIAGSTTPAAFELFLKRFPDGNYADFARHRLEELKRQAMGAPPTPQAVNEEQKRAAEQAEQQLALNQAQRRRVQGALAVKGFDTGASDGNFQARTRQMIANYQRSRSEPGTGFLSAPQYAALIKETQEALAKLEAERAARPAPTPQPVGPQPAAVVAVPAPRAMTLPPVTPPPAGNRFDGNWSAVIRCPNEGTARGYTISVAGRVSNNVMRLSKGEQGAPDYLVLQGTIGPDGAATLHANGFTNNPAFTLGNLPAGTPVNYAVAARFEGVAGTGQRLGSRACSVSFSRH